MLHRNTKMKVTYFVLAACSLSAFAKPSITIAAPKGNVKVLTQASTVQNTTSVVVTNATTVGNVTINGTIAVTNATVLNVTTQQTGPTESLTKQKVAKMGTVVKSNAKDKSRKLSAVADTKSQPKPIGTMAVTNTTKNNNDTTIVAHSKVTSAVAANSRGSHRPKSPLQSIFKNKPGGMVVVEIIKRKFSGVYACAFESGAKKSNRPCPNEQTNKVECNGNKLNLTYQGVNATFTFCNFNIGHMLEPNYVGMAVKKSCSPALQRIQGRCFTGWECAGGPLGVIYNNRPVALKFCIKKGIAFNPLHIFGRDLPKAATKNHKKTAP